MSVNNQLGGAAQLTVHLEPAADLSPADAKQVRDLAGGL